MADIVPEHHPHPAVFRLHQGYGGVAAHRRFRKPVQGIALQLRQQQPDGVAMGHHGDGFPFVLPGDLLHRRQHPLQHLPGRLRPLHVPFFRVKVEIHQLLFVRPGNVAPGLLLPPAHADLPQVPPPVKLQPLGPVDGAGGGAGAVQVAGVNGVDPDIGEAPPQRLHLPPAPVGEDAVVLALCDAVQVAFRLRVADEIDSGHRFLPAAYSIRI